MLICSSSETGDFERIDVTLAQVLAENTRVALSRIDREQELQHQKDQLEDFAGVVSHDLRNPLNVARSHLELAEETGNPDHFESIADALARMEGIVEDLLTLARQGSTIGDPQPVGLERVARRAWRNVETETATLQVRVDPQIRADPGRLGQFFENLFRNPIEHAGEDVTIRVGNWRIDPAFSSRTPEKGFPPRTASASSSRDSPRNTEGLASGWR